MIRFARLALGALLLASLAQSSAAQALDDQWLKLKVKAKGFTIDGNGVVEKASYTTTVYLFLNADGGLYDYQIRWESAPGVWSTSGFANFSPIGENDDVVTDHSFTIQGEGGVSFTFDTTFRFKIKLDGEGNFKKAALKSDSGHVTGGTLDGASNFHGSVTLTGTTIATNKLPFVVV
jgi:hypothetical protein